MSKTIFHVVVFLLGAATGLKDKYWEKNQVLKKKNATLSSHLTTQMGELADEFTKLRKCIKRKEI
jgi:hypothetical protein